MVAEKKIENALNVKNMSDLECAKEVLRVEIEGLQKLSDSLGDEFTQAIETFYAMQSSGKNGRLIVAGIGKSGHVARKIAATMASTGTPAYFVHPGEASHGDMGMITENDAVLMLSNSGENSELSDLIHFTRRYGISLVSITSNPVSTLAKNSDIALLLPKTPEACPNGMAPTTSTTMMMALGDAIAVSLLKRRGLTKEQYKVFHPGGKLGQKLKLVSELMIVRADMALIGIDAAMDAAILKLSEKNLGSVCVIDDSDNLAGIITDGDLKRHMGPDLLSKPVKDVMSKSPKTIDETKLAAEALKVMTETPGHYITSLIAVDAAGKMTGMIRLQDCLQEGLA